MSVEAQGQQYQHGTSTFTVILGSGTAVLPMRTVSKVSFKVSAPTENTNDSQGQVDGFVARKSEHSASISMKLSEWFVLRAALAQSPSGVLRAQFQFVQTYGNAVNALHKLEAFQCMINEEAYASEDSQDPDMMDLPLNFQRLLIDGKPPVAYEVFA